MRLLGHCLLFLVTFLLCIRCFGQSGTAVKVIRDPSAVARLQLQIKEKQRLQKMKEAKRKKSLVDAYKSGDRRVVPAIIGILKGNDKTKKRELIDQLAKNSWDPSTYSIKDQQIIDLVLNDVDNPVFEKSAIQLAGFNELPGYVNKFEARLLSGKSTDEFRLLWWLGSRTTSTKTLDYITSRVKENNIKPATLNSFIYGLGTFGEYGNPEIRTRVGNIALGIYREKLIPDNDFEALTNTEINSGSAVELLKCLFAYGDTAVIPIARDMFARGILIDETVKALIRLEGAQHIEKIYPYLENEEHFFTGLSLMETIGPKYVDDKLLKEVLIQFGKREEVADYQIERLVETFKKLGREAYINDCATFINGELADRLKRCYALSNISTAGILAELQNKGLIAKQPDTATINKALESSDNPTDFIYQILQVQNLYFYFDTETGVLPVNYDELLQEFARKSDGVLKDITVWLDAKEKPGSKFSYVITVIYKGYAYLVKPEDVGDWYDVAAVESLLDKMLERSGSSKRFNSIDTGDQTAQYIFGVPAVVEEVLKKYKL